MVVPGDGLETLTKIFIPQSKQQNLKLLIFQDS